MKIKYWPIVVGLLLLPWLAEAGTQSQLGAKYGSKGATAEMLASASCSAPSADELSEGFGGSGYENTWNETLDGGTIDEDFTLEGSPPSDSCTEGLRIYSTDANDPKTVWDRGSSIARGSNDVDMKLTLYIDSNTSWGDWITQHVASWDSDTNPGGNTSTCQLMVQHTTGGTFRCWAEGTVDSTTVTLSTDTWYTITIHADSTAADGYIVVEGGGSETCDQVDECGYTRRDGSDGRYMLIGIVSQAGGATTDYHIGYITVNTP